MNILWNLDYMVIFILLVSYTYGINSLNFFNDSDNIFVWRKINKLL